MEFEEITLKILDYIVDRLEIESQRYSLKSVEKEALLDIAIKVDNLKRN